jgi:hypothetical protein
VNTAYAPPATDIDVPRARALAVAGIGLIGCAIGLYMNAEQFYRSWLIAYLLFLGITLGSMAFVMIQHLSGGAWGVFRRIFEASSRTILLLIVLFIPVLIGRASLYPWTDAVLQTNAALRSDEVIRHKAPYFNEPFFFARVALYFVVWWGLSHLLNKWSQQQDTGDVAVNLRMQRLSGAGLVLYALTVTFAGVDWIMSLNPHWYSTLFGFLMMGGQGLAALAFTIVVANFLFRREPMSRLLKPQHFADLGKLTFAFVMLYAYFNFSQYMLIFAANVVEEIPYMTTRIQNGWQYLALFLTIFHFAVPWLLLLSRSLKRNAHRLVVVAAWLIVMRFADIYMLVTPEFASDGRNLHTLTGEHASHFFLYFTDLAAPLAIGGLWVWMFFTQLKQRPLFAAGDPYLREALESGGGH